MLTAPFSPKWATRLPQHMLNALFQKIASQQKPVHCLSSARVVRPERRPVRSLFGHALVRSFGELKIVHNTCHSSAVSVLPTYVQYMLVHGNEYNVITIRKKQLRRLFHCNFTSCPFHNRRLLVPTLTSLGNDD